MLVQRGELPAVLGVPGFVAPAEMQDRRVRHDPVEPRLAVQALRLPHQPCVIRGDPGCAIAVCLVAAEFREITGTSDCIENGTWVDGGLVCPLVCMVTAPRIYTSRTYPALCRIVVNVANCVQRLNLRCDGDAVKPTIKQRAGSLMPAIEPASVSRGERMHEIGEGIGFVADDHMHVVAHQTPSDDAHVIGTSIRVEIRKKTNADRSRPRK